MNAVETAFYVYYLWVVWSRGRVRSGRGRGKVRSGAKLAWFVGWSEGGRRKTVEGPGVSRAVLILFAGAVMTVSKTVLYCESRSSYTRLLSPQHVRDWMDICP